MFNRILTWDFRPPLRAGGGVLWRRVTVAEGGQMHPVQGVALLRARDN